MIAYRSVTEVEREHELDVLARLLNERWRPVPPPPADDTRRRLIADAMRLIASALED